MTTKTTRNHVQPLAPEKMATVQAAMQAWLRRETANGDFETRWANAGNPMGGGLVNVDSAEEFEIVMFG